MWRMYKRGKPVVHCILIDFVTLKIVMSIMAERVEGEKHILKTFIVDVEEIKGTIKCIAEQMKSFADNMETLKHRMDSFEEDMIMTEILGAELSKLRKTVANMKKSEESYEHDSTISSTTFEVIYDEDD